MPSFLALSTSLFWMPLPGNIITPIGRISSIWSLRLNGAALACFGPVGPEGDLRRLSMIGPAGGYQFGALRRPSVQQDHVGIFGADLVELFLDQAVVVEVGAAGEANFGPAGNSTSLSARRLAARSSGANIVGVASACCLATAVDGARHARTDPSWAQEF
jgi:hypothetical protein